MTKLFQTALPLLFALQAGTDHSLLVGRASSAFWEWERVLVQILFLVLLILISSKLGKIILRAESQDAQTVADRLAREKAIKRVTEIAEDLRRKTEEIASAKAIIDLATKDEIIGSIKQGVDEVNPGQVLDEIKDTGVDTNTRVRKVEVEVKLKGNK